MTGHHTLHHVFDGIAMAVAWLSFSVTLAGVQSVTAIVASVLSASYLVLRIATDPWVRRQIAALRGKNKTS